MRYLTIKKHKAFTLIELLIVVAIIGVLAGMVTLQYYNAKDRANYSRVLADMTEIAKAVKVYAVQNNNIYPFEVPSNTVPAGLGSYFNSGFPKTPCNNTYKYDYQNWLVSDCTDNTADTTASNYVVGINFMKSIEDEPTYIYYVDVKNFGTVCGSGGTGDGGDTIYDAPDKEIVCNE